jgi:hypothetical protein
MSKFLEKVEKYKASMDKLGIKRNDALLTAVTKACGPSIYNKDGETVSTTSKDEMERLKKNFLMKKLGLSASDDLEGGIKYATEKIGASNRNKYRAIFYFLLVRKFKKEGLFV